jgi:hypothetical protein
MTKGNPIGPLESKLNDVSLIREDIGVGFANGALGDAEYYGMDNFPEIKAHEEMLAADIEGPAIIRLIHVTRHAPKEIFARGIVIEIWFDDAKEPAVSCPLADFFGDGCNGDSMYFTSNYIECAPWSYNCYIPMPFRKRARIIVRNDTDTNLRACYIYIEWEKLAKIDDRQGYFHASYERRTFALTTKTDELFLDLKGKGHILGRQLSIISHDPMFNGFSFIMEGDNEIDIDGFKRAINYMGSEDSFTFSWGYQHLFAGKHAGITLMENADPSRLSVYRFHDHMPLRFNKSLRWSICWQNEQIGTPEWQAFINPAWLADGAIVDYATVFYWYQDVPGGFQHVPLKPAGPER